MNSLYKKIIAICLIGLLLFPATVITTKAEMKAPKLLGELHNQDKAQLNELEIQQLKKEKLVSDDTLIVKYKKPLSLQLHRNIGTSFVKRISELSYDIVKLPKGKNKDEVIKAYSRLEEVLAVTPSVSFKTLTSIDPKEASMYHLHQLKINEALKLKGENEVVIAVIDTGLDTSHPELKNQVLRDFNVIDPLKRSLVDVHGTHVAGIIAAEAGNDIGGKGINPYAKIVPIDVFNRSWGASDYIIAEGILYAIEQKVDIINLSLGSHFPSPILKDAVEKALKAGITIVAAAGNDGTSVYNYPASFPGVISVGATNEALELASFSSYGPNISIVAPGEDIYAPIFDIDKHSTFKHLSGTSMATPIVTGVVSLLLSKHPDLTPFEVKYIIEQTADDLGEPGYDLTFGFGFINPIAALNYDVTKLPRQKKYDHLKTYEYAKEVELDYETTLVKKGNLTIAEQEDWYSVSLSSGEYVQIELEASDQYDYELLLNFLSMHSEGLEIINDVREGNVEGYLFKATEQGALTIGVRDYNQKYDENGNSSYDLSLTKYKAMNRDENTSFNPTVISSFPYSSLRDEKEPYFLNEEEADSDYFRFTATEKEVVEVMIDALPGVDIMLNLYSGEEFDLHKENLQFKNSAQEGHMIEPFPIASGNQFGIGKGEYLAFEVEREKEYVIEVTNAAFDFFDLFFYENLVNERKPASSAHPYHLKILADKLPDDEDGYPFYMETEMSVIEDELLKEAKKQESNKITDPYFFEERNHEEMFEKARALQLGSTATGYFQYQGDIDLFKVEPVVNGIYQFSFKKTKTLAPRLEVLKLDEETNELQPIAFSEGSNFSLAVDDETVEVFVGLEKGQQYLVSFENGFSPSLYEYRLSSDVIVENPEDAYWGNKTFATAKKLPAHTITGNFALSSERDVFYFDAVNCGTYGFVLENVKPSKREKEGLPDQLFTPLMPGVLIIEDKNKDGDISDQELQSAKYLYGDSNERFLRGSFKVTKGSRYFIQMMSDLYYNGGASLTKYRLSVAPANKSKGITPLLKTDKGKWVAQGFVATHHTQANSDRHRFLIKEGKTIKITADTPGDLDGVITIYNSDGTLLAKSDYYGIGDAEVVTAKLEEGTYYIQVTDYFGHGSIQPYTLIIEE